MSRTIRSWLLWMAVLATSFCVGCFARPSANRPKPPEQKLESRGQAAKPRPEKAKAAAPSTERPSASTGATRESQHAQPAPPPTIPAVVLSDELRAACLVKVGDKLPDAELSDLDGKPRALHSLFGKKLTVVCFWTIGDTERSKLLSAALLGDLAKSLPKPGGDRDVVLVGVNVGDSAEAVRRQLKQAEASFPNLLDRQGKLLAKVTKDGKTPRIYLLDSNGRILWFDLENSRSSRRNLEEAIQVVLGKK